MKRIPILAIVGLAFLNAAAVHAGAKPQVVLTVDVKEEISRADAQGKIQVIHQAVQKTEPGDVLLYTLTYTNVGDSPAVDAKVDDPIPAGTVLLPGSAKGERARITASIDGARSFAPYPAKQVVTGLDGGKVEAEVPADSYTHVRWIATEPLAPGESRTASFKVVVR